MKQSREQQQSVDITLLLEGSYPFVVGGVSSWVHQMIQAFPQYQFAIIFLGSRSEDYPQGLRYELPKNVVHLEKHYLFSDEDSDHGTLIKRQKHHHPLSGFYLLEGLADQAGLDKFHDLNFYIDVKKYKTFDSFFETSVSWSFIVTTYSKYCTDPSFINYFWTVLSLQKPLWKIAKIAQDFIETKLIHAISTGYAGFLGAILNRHYHYPLVLTEHGIYTKERRIELLQTQILGEADLSQRFATEISYFRNLWMRYFEVLSRLCYQFANPITCLYQGALKKQIEEGAEESRTQIIPNGIDVEKFAKFRHEVDLADNPILCLIGRVVPIKDIKTFIRSMSIIVKHVPKAEAWIVGPVDENKEYYQECQNLISVLDLNHRIKIKPGRQDVAEIYPKIALLILSSISEGMPLVVLEGFAAGVPAVTTAVGNCRDLIEGTDDKEDKALGLAGRIVQIADPQKLANACLELLQNNNEWQGAQKAAIARVEKYYDQALMFRRYQAIYDQVIEV